MREPFAKRIIAAMEEVVADLKKGKEGMQESGDDKFVNEKKLQTKVNPMGIRNDKEPADVPLDIDELSYSKKKKPQFLQVPPNQPAVYDANTAGDKMSKDKEKKYDINRVEQIHSAWKANKTKKAKEEEKYDINRVEQIKTTRADDYSPEETVEKAVNMGVSALRSTLKLLMELINTLDEDNVQCLAQPWVQNKISLANDYVLSVHDYVMFHNEYGENEDEEKDEPQKLSKAPKSDSYFGNFDGHDGHSYSADKPDSKVKLKKDKSDYEGGNF